MQVLVVRHGGELFALSDTCAHRGGALHEGELVDGCVQCPLHSSRFRLRDGGLVQGPSAYPQPAWETRVRDGRVEVAPAPRGVRLVAGRAPGPLTLAPRELLRPPPHRGPLIASGAVLLTVGLALIELRADGLADGWRALIFGAATALVLGLGIQAPNEGGGRRPPVGAAGLRPAAALRHADPHRRHARPRRRRRRPVRLDRAAPGRARRLGRRARRSAIAA